MTSVAVLSVEGEKGEVSYQAVAGEHRSEGQTVGEALDKLTDQLQEPEGTLIVVQYGRPDAFFTAAQQKRLAELMQAWRTARDLGSQLPPAEQQELSELVDAELEGSARRAAALADAAGL
jgi:hypothetical protein